MHPIPALTPTDDQAWLARVLALFGRTVLKSPRAGYTGPPTFLLGVFAPYRDAVIRTARLLDPDAPRVTMWVSPATGRQWFSYQRHGLSAAAALRPIAPFILGSKGDRIRDHLARHDMPRIANNLRLVPDQRQIARARKHYADLRKLPNECERDPIPEILTPWDLPWYERIGWRASPDPATLPSPCPLTAQP